MELYDGTLSYLDLYILGAHGAGRQRAQILNQFDPCCYGGINYQTYAGFVEAAVANVGLGSQFVYLDTESPEHSVSPDVLRNFNLRVDGRESRHRTILLRGSTPVGSGSAWNPVPWLRPELI